MTGTVLILGANGRFGGHAARAFEAAGWRVTRFDRATGDLRAAALRADVVVNGWNPPDYSYWQRDLVPMHQRVIDAVSGTGATVILPGNVYVFGADTPAPWSETSPQAAANSLGRLRIEIEQAYRRADMRCIILRGGDFLDTAPSGNWFDLLMVAKLRKGRFVYPGEASIPHVWAYLPDIARAAVQLAEARAGLPKFADIPFPGFTLTGADIAAHLEALTGRPVRLKPLSWWPLLLGQHVMPNLKGLCEMRYLWRTPHTLDPACFDACLPGFKPTSVQRALQSAIAHTGTLRAAGEVYPDQAVSVQG